MRYEEILRKTAGKFNSTPEEVEKEIQKALDAAYANPDPETRKIQSKIPSCGERPTIEEFILGVVEILRK